ncbi:three component ABC system middle component [Paraburkholderia sp. RL17-337-BIB-A]|uniref:three component ABC system middle component n=1 Tax=Paraburkholderia sp. RL17-337-BIB-A TaxID=3031636 RepID=UPI0038BBA517
MLNKEMWQVQNPGLGAALIWQFGRGFASQSEEAVPLPYAFFVVPLLFNKSTLEVVVRTNKGLRKIDEKLNNDETIATTALTNVLSMRDLSSESLGIAVRASLLAVQAEDATFRSRVTAPPVLEGKMPKELMKAAEKLGRWAAGVSLREFCFVFRLEL